MLATGSHCEYAKEHETKDEAEGCHYLSLMLDVMFDYAVGES